MLKIDRHFVGRVGDDPRQRTLVGAVCELGRAFGMKVVAEGIEQDEQAAVLRSLGCELGQGYRYGRPMPAEQLLQLMLEQAGQADGGAASNAAISSSSNATVKATMLA